MDLNEILVFTKVVQTGGFTAAARELDMPKSTVSRKVSDLESRLGARLLQRTTRRLSLTDVGRTYFAYCTRIVAEVEEAERAVTRLHETPRGALRITAPLAFSFLGQVVADYLARFPEVRVEMVCTDRVVDLVEEGFDLAIRAGALRDSTLIARRIGSGRRLVVASPHYLARRGVPDSPENLPSHDCMSFGGGQDWRVWRLRREERALEIPIEPHLLVNDFDILRAAAVAGLGITMLPAERCDEDLRAGRLEQLLPDWTAPETVMHAVYPSTRHLSPKVKSFVDHLHQPR